MSKTNLSKIVHDTQLVLSKHSPEILTGFGIAGMVTTTVLAVKATPKAMRLLEERRTELYPDSTQSLPPKEVVKTAWKCYIPAAIIGTASIGCLIGASKVSLRRNAALATAYKLSETALTEYKGKVIETIGERKEKVVKEAIAKDKIANDPPRQQDIIITGKGDTLCYDVMCGRYFKSDMEKLKKIENELNRRMRSENYISLNEFYYEVGLDEVAAGHDLGWDIDNGYIELEFNSLLTPDGSPCLTVGFSRPPRYEFR